jgi:hypothetical protein
LVGRGGAKTKLLTFPHAIELVMVLPGKLAKETRTKFANIITRYIAGDTSLVGEIEANAESSSPIAQMARAAVAEDARKRKAGREDLEIAERWEALKRREIEDDMMRAEIARKNEETEQMRLNIPAEVNRKLMENVVFKNNSDLELIVNRMNAVEKLAGLQGLEDRDKVAYRALLNIGAGMHHRSLQNDDRTATTVQYVVGHMHFKKITNDDYQQIGRIASAKYLATNGKKPSKHEGIAANGSKYDINDYYDEDVPMIQEAAKEYMAKKTAVSTSRINFPRVAKN